MKPCADQMVSVTHRSAPEPRKRQVRLGKFTPSTHTVSEALARYMCSPLFRLYQELTSKDKKKHFYILHTDEFHNGPWGLQMTIVIGFIWVAEKCACRHEVGHPSGAVTIITIITTIIMNTLKAMEITVDDNTNPRSYLTLLVMDIMNVISLPCDSKWDKDIDFIYIYNKYI